MASPIPYCGSAPSPGELLSRFNLDPVLITGLAAVCALQIVMLHRRRGSDARRREIFALAGWLVAGASLLSPLCALSVALFSARVGQHMVLVLIAAPLIALGLPRGTGWSHAWRL